MEVGCSRVCLCKFESYDDDEVDVITGTALGSGSGRLIMKSWNDIMSSCHFLTLCKRQ